jgi:hypothetical protein
MSPHIAHGGHSGLPSTSVPPQSTPVSPPFCTPSVHDGAAHLSGRLVPVGKQTWLWQSPGWRHFAPGAHCIGHAAPQSMSDSAPFCTWSEHEGAWHMLPTQIWLKQSEGRIQTLFAAQGRQSGPPQSLSVSFPSLVPSVQWLGTQVPCEQMGAVSTPHEVPGLHAAQTKAPLLIGSGLFTQKPAVPPIIVHGCPDTGLSLSAPLVQENGSHSFPLLNTLVSSTTLIIFPCASHVFLWQFPYCCESAGPAVYVTPHT